MNQLLDGQTAVVTGAASGLGRAISLTFAEHGADVVVADIREDPKEGGYAPAGERHGLPVRSRGVSSSALATAKCRPEH
jgi:NAD(P)-dependent dehydrogenase (short-subunit alcohol dehydrogenase family)